MCLKFSCNPQIDFGHFFHSLDLVISAQLLTKPIDMHWILGMQLLLQFEPGTEVIKLFSCSTQLSTKFILLINVGIITFISMINTTSDRLKARNFFICQYFSFYEQLKFRAQLS